MADKRTSADTTANKSSTDKSNARVSTDGEGSGKPPPKYVIRQTGEAAKNWDFLAARPPQKRLNTFEAATTIVKGALGGGVVAMHESYKLTGLWSAVVLNVFLGIFVGYMVHILVYCTQVMYGRLKVPMLSYPDLAEAVVATCPFPRLRKFDKTLRYLVDLTVMVDLFGSCVVYMVVIARASKQIMEKTESTDDSGIRWYILALLLPCMLISWITDIKYLQPFAQVANVFILVVSISTIYYGVKNADKSPLEFEVFKGVKGLFLYMGATIFSMESVGACMTIENQLKQPRKFDLPLTLGMMFVITIVMMTGFFGYWGFGELSKSPITLNFPWSTYSVTLKVLMAIVIYVTFGLNFHVPFTLCWHYLKKLHKTKLWFWERLYRTIGVLVICGIAVAFPSVVSFVGLLGSFCLANMGFMYPVLLECLVQWEEPGLGIMKWRLFKWLIVFIYGFMLCMIGTYTGVLGVIKEMKGSK